MEFSVAIRTNRIIFEFLSLLAIKVISWMTYWLNVHRYENIHLLEQSIGKQALAELAPSSGLIKVIIVESKVN